MTTAPLFTIITVCRDNAPGLRRTYESLRAQGFQDFVWVVIDGASTDGTIHFLNTTNAAWRSEPDAGIYDAMNKGIARAHGDYLWFLNAGDCLAGPDVLAAVARAIQSCPAPPDFVYGDSLESGHIKPARPYTKINQGMFTHHQAMIYRRAAAGDLRYDTRYKIAADYDFTWRFLEKTKSQINLKIPLCDFEPGGVSQKNAILGRREQFAVRRALGMAWPKNLGIYGLQTGLFALRRHCPALYWRLKSSGNKRAA